MSSYIPLLVASIGAVGAVAAAWIARQAQRNTKPLSNGFAGDVTRRLDRIECLITSHIQAHADHDVSRRR